MKTCSYCGHKNEDAAVACSECGTSEFDPSPRQVPAEPEIEKTFTVLKVFASAQAADVVAGLLRANGIDCTIAADGGGGMLVNLQTVGGVRILVPTDSLDEAREILEGPRPG